MPNCYDCTHRRNLPGTAHSKCAHPVIEPTHLSDLFEILGGGIDVEAAMKLGITAKSHGIRSGWFSWPYNFDPVWLETCEGFNDRNTDGRQDATEKTES